MTSQTLWPPDPSRGADWWDEFWRDERRDFGAPSERVLKYAEVWSGPGHKSAVDVGAGNGRYAIPLAAMGFDVTAVESAPAGVARIRASAARHGVTVDGDVPFAVETQRRLS